MDTKASAIIKRLHRLNGFTDHFPNLSLSPSTDSVTHLWEILSTGTPLCYIFDQLPEDEDFMKINLYSLTEGPYKPNSDRAMKRAIAIFALQVRAKPVFDKIPGCEIFNVEDLWDRGSTGGLVKVCSMVIGYSYQQYLIPHIATGAQHCQCDSRLSSPRGLQGRSRIARPFYNQLQYCRLQ